MYETPPAFKYDGLFKKALNNLLRKKDYHVAPPTKKSKMLVEEYSRLLKKKDL